MAVPAPVGDDVAVVHQLIVRSLATAHAAPRKAEAGRVTA
jgi:hypothetical protein